MKGSEIKDFFDQRPNLSRCFRGVFAADQVRRLRLRNRTAAVINTGVLRSHGFHWYAVIKVENRIEVFDSLGTSEEEVKQRLGHFKLKFYFNSSAVQEETSSNCGLFCCYFLQVRLLNLDLKFSEVS
jgi:hypothetical protein